MDKVSTALLAVLILGGCGSDSDLVGEGPDDRSSEGKTKLLDRVRADIGKAGKIEDEEARQELQSAMRADEQRLIGEIAALSATPKLPTAPAPEEKPAPPVVREDKPVAAEPAKPVPPSRPPETVEPVHPVAKAAPATPSTPEAPPPVSRAVITAPAMGQPTNRDPFLGRKLEERVEVTFQVGYNLRGILSVPRGLDPKTYDLTKADMAALDISMEFERANGTIAFEKLQVAEVQKLEGISPGQLRWLLEKKKAAQEKLNREDRERIARFDKLVKDEADARAKAFDKAQAASKIDANATDKGENDKKALQFYSKYPEDKGWGEAKYADLAKYLVASGQENPPYLDARLTVTSPTGKVLGPADPGEADFYGHFELWKQGREVYKAFQKTQTPAPQEPPK